MASLRFLHRLIIIVTATFLVIAHSVVESQPVVLSLKAQSSPHTSLLLRNLRSPGSSANKLSFSHDVTLTASLSVGSPPQPVTMVLDTGSELSWLHVKKTATSAASVFDPRVSKSFSPVLCSSSTCRTRTRDFSIPASCDPKNLCHAVISYADASSVEGYLASDTFRVGSEIFESAVFGSMDSGFSSNPVEDSRTTGLMGMNRGSLSFVSQMGFPKFSYCISGLDKTGILLFGEPEPGSSWLKPLNYTPMVRITDPLPYFDRAAYTVRLDGIRVSGTVLPLPKSVLEPDHTGAGQTMVDSGTQFTFLLGPVYYALKTEFSRQMRGVLEILEDENFVFQGAMDLCYRVPISRNGSLPKLPTVSLMFRGAEMSVSGETVLYRVPGEVRGSDSVYCMTFGNSDLLGIEAFVIGHHHQQNVWVEFDLANSRVGFADTRCDLASQRLLVGPT